jgi:DNA-binding HxlR family transcriptional regulator
MRGNDNSLIGYLEQRNALTVLRALHHISNPHWSLVKEYAIKKLEARSLSDYSYRRLCKQLVSLNLARMVERDPVKKDYHLTHSGHETARIIEEALERVEKWRTRAFKNAKKSMINRENKGLS